MGIGNPPEKDRFASSFFYVPVSGMLQAHQRNAFDLFGPTQSLATQSKAERPNLPFRCVIDSFL